MLLFFFFNIPAPPKFYPLSLHAPLPISPGRRPAGIEALHIAAVFREQRRLAHAKAQPRSRSGERDQQGDGALVLDRKSTRLNSSHANISYAVFCLKKKKKNKNKYEFEYG